MSRTIGTLRTPRSPRARKTKATSPALHTHDLSLLSQQLLALAGLIIVATLLLVFSSRATRLGMLRRGVDPASLVSLDRFIPLQIGEHELAVEPAVSPEEQGRGLSGRPFLPANHGMLFLFDDSAIRSFWMKEMLFPLDLIWINGDRHVVGITKYVLPESYPATFSPRVPVQYVLEVNAGWTDSAHILPGDTIAF